MSEPNSHPSPDPESDPPTDEQSLSQSESDSLSPTLPAYQEGELGGLDPHELIEGGLQSRSKPAAWEPPTPEELSRLLPQYEIDSLIGRGGMGAVYRGRQATLDRLVAIKLLPAEMAADADFVARFKREARTLAKLHHPGIVLVHDFGQTDEGHLYFVMEFVDGTDLYKIIHGPGLDCEQALEIVGQICDALQYAHSEGVVHRDIKPANVIVALDGRAKLADFGLARPTDDGSGIFTQTSMVMGTPDYMAPEALAGEADHRADLYSLGIMLYEMLTGKPPRGAWDPPSHRVKVDVRLDEVVVRALQENPDLRYQQASEIKTDVEGIRSTPLPRKMRRRKSTGAGDVSKGEKKKGRTGVFLGVAALAVAIAVGVGQLMERTSNESLPWEEMSFRAKNEPIPLPEDGWMETGSGMLHVSSAKPDGKYVELGDAAVRLRVRWTEKNITGPLAAWFRTSTDSESPDGQIKFFLFPDRLTTTRTNRGTDEETIHELLLEQPFAPGDEAVFEFGGIGDELYASVGGQVAHVTAPGIRSEGWIMLGGWNHQFRDVQYLQFDRIEDPLKELGWEMEVGKNGSDSEIVFLPTPAPEVLAARERGGRLRVFGNGLLEGVELGRAAEFSDFQSVVVNHECWAARRKQGDTLAMFDRATSDTSEPPTELGPYFTNFLQRGTVPVMQMTSDGSYRNIFAGGSQHRNEWANHRAVAFLNPGNYILSLDEDGRILRGESWFGPEYSDRLAPPNDFFLGAIAYASPMDHYVSARPGLPVRSFNVSTGAIVDFPESIGDIVEMDAFREDIILRNVSGQVFVASAGGELSGSVPEDLGPAIAVRTGLGMSAAQMTDGTWRAWGNSDDLVRNTARIGHAIDVDFHSGGPGSSAYMMWIEPVGESVDSSTPQWKPVPLTQEQEQVSEASDGWWTYQRDDGYFNKPHHRETRFLNGGVRFEFKPKKEGSLNLNLRNSDESELQCRLELDGTFRLVYRNEEIFQHVFSSWKPGEPNTVEVTVIGKVMRIGINGEVFERGSLPLSHAGVFGFGLTQEMDGVELRNLEYINLDDLSIRKAREMLGWDIPEAGLPSTEVPWHRAVLDEDQTSALTSDGWFTIGGDEQARFSPLTADERLVTIANGVVAANLRRTSRLGCDVTLWMRIDGSKGESFRFQITETELIAKRDSGENEVILGRTTFNSPFAFGDEERFEAVAVGDHFVARFKGEELRISDPDGISSGAVLFIGHNYELKDFEYAILDGIPDPLAALGWEEENAATAPPSSGSVATSKPIWHRVEEQGRPWDDGRLVKQDGWVKMGENADAYWQKGDQQFRNIAFRVQYRWNQGPRSLGLVRSRNLDGGVSFTLWPKEMKLLMTNLPSAVKLPDQVLNLAQSLPTDHEGILELAVIGERVIARHDGRLAFDCVQPGLPDTAFIEVRGSNVRVRNFEYAILDGIPDPLAALGWEEPIESTSAVVWNDFLAEIEDGPNRNDQLGRVWTREDGGWQVKQYHAFSVPDDEGRDLEIRVKGILAAGEDTGGNAGMSLFVREQNGRSYAGRLFNNGTAKIQQGATVLKSFRLGPDFDPKTSHTLELRSEGDLLTLIVDGVELGSVKDDTLPRGGNLTVSASEGSLIEKVEYRFLDGSSSVAIAGESEWKGLLPDQPSENNLPQIDRAESGREWTGPLHHSYVPVEGLTNVLFSTWETRVKDFEAFVKETGHDMSGLVNADGDSSLSWQNPGFEQTGDHPVVLVSREDANAYCRWLTETERAAGRLLPGQVYRLPTDREWSAAMGVLDEKGDFPSEREFPDNVFTWSRGTPPPHNSENLRWTNDDFQHTAPVGSGIANQFGIYDLLGNVEEVCADPWSINPMAPSIVVRGSAYNSEPKVSRFNVRGIQGEVRMGSPTQGFRCILDLKNEKQRAIQMQMEKAVSSLHELSILQNKPSREISSLITDEFVLLDLSNWNHLNQEESKRLEGLPLTHLMFITGDSNGDLGFMKTLPLEVVLMSMDPHANVETLTANLAGLPLTHVTLYHHPDLPGGKESLDFLRGASLRQLHLWNFRNLNDMNALRGMPLEILSLRNSAIPDLTALHDAPMESISLEPKVPSLEMFLDGLEWWDQNVFANVPVKQIASRSLGAASTSWGRARVAELVTETEARMKAIPYLQSREASESITPVLQEQLRFATSAANWLDGEPGSLANDSRTHGNHAYLLTPWELDFDSASEFARALGAHLVTITTPEENAFVSQMLDEVDTRVEPWLGLVQKGKGREGWEWETGEAVAIHNWATERSGMTEVGIADVARLGVGKTEIGRPWKHWSRSSSLRVLLEWDTPVPQLPVGPR